MRILKAVFIVASSLLPVVAFAGSPGGTITGFVVDDRGAPIANALVLYRSVQTITRAANGDRVTTGPSVGSGVKTAADGSFAVNGLPAATYHLCAPTGRRTIT